MECEPLIMKACMSFLQLTRQIMGLRMPSTTAAVDVMATDVAVAAVGDVMATDVAVAAVGDVMATDVVAAAEGGTVSTDAADMVMEGAGGAAHMKVSPWIKRTDIWKPSLTTGSSKLIYDVCAMWVS